MSALIEARDLVRDYTFGRGTVHALRGVTLTVGANEAVCIVGPSGSGKSTLLHLVGCLDRPTSGEIVIAGERVGDLSDSRLSRFRRDRIGFIFQSFSLIPVLTAFENIEYPLLLAGAPASVRRERVRALVDEMGLEPHQHRYPNLLSGGQQQRVAIARALVTRPPIVLADEPTAHLDSTTSVEILDLMRTMGERLGGTLIFSTHDPEVLRYGRRMIRLHDGRVESDTLGTLAAR